jgi:hypothetical protein
MTIWVLNKSKMIDMVGGAVWADEGVHMLVL